MPLFRVGKPRFRVLRTTDQACIAGYNDVVWEVVDYDDVSGFDGVSTYTIDRGGLYLLNYRAARAVTTTSQSLLIRPTINGVTQPSTRVSLSGTPIAGGATSDLLELDTGDAVRMQVQGHASAAWSLLGSHTAWSVVRLGPIAWT